MLAVHRPIYNETFADGAGMGDEFDMAAKERAADADIGGISDAEMISRHANYFLVVKRLTAKGKLDLRAIREMLDDLFMEEVVAAEAEQSVRELAEREAV